jgi:predicted AAA+ superfamily ATPase
MRSSPTASATNPTSCSIASRSGSLNDETAVYTRLQQMQQVRDFFQRWFVDVSNQTPSAACWSFHDAAGLEEMLDTHLRDLIRRRIHRDHFEEFAVAPHYFGNPFRGLLSFELKDAAVFFGRTRARNELRELLACQAERGSAFVLVFGASGSGKSSLVKAGLPADLVLPGMAWRSSATQYCAPPIAVGGSSRRW